MPAIKLMLVDDHDIVRTGIRMLLGAQSDMEIVVEVNSGAMAIEAAGQHDIDVVLMDVSMPEMDGIEATRQLKARCPTLAILALTIHEEEEYLFQMLDAGASGYIPKRVAPEDLLQAIRAVHRGEVFLHPSVAGALVNGLMHGKQSAASETGLRLTSREREVMILIAEGLTNKRIGEQLEISPKTVARHRDNISAKLGLSSRAEFTRYAIQRGLIEA
jgi:DNA-binding NarL/FixJ family response regulator